MLARIVSLGYSKQAINTDDLPFIIAEVLESKNYQHLKLLNFHCTHTLNFEQEDCSSAWIDAEAQWPAKPVSEK